MGAAESTSRTNGTNQEEQERKQKSSTVVGAVSTIAAVGAAAWGISRMLSDNTDTKMMKAPGKPTEMIKRDAFEANPKEYFANLRGKV